MGGAKNCPETPRQKMIGMMYLVLTAMLALNVSTDILNGFTLVDNSLHSSIAASDTRNAKLYPEINSKFLHFYQDSTLQMLIGEAEQQYADMEDINEEINNAFQYLKKELPNIEIPQIYSQIGSLAQSIIVGNGMIGICLDKYLGMEFDLYLRPEYGYSLDQRRMMQRQYIVPDCIGFYLLSLYPMPYDQPISQAERDVHLGRIQWVVNKAIGRDLFRSMYVQKVDRFMSRNKNMKVEQLLGASKYSDFL